MIESISLQNLGTVNKNRVIIERGDGITFILYFSYETIVGITYRGKRCVIENQWSTTTGKLLNELEPDKSKRIKPEQFYQEIKEMFLDMNN